MQLDLRPALELLGSSSLVILMLMIPAQVVVLFPVVALSPSARASHPLVLAALPSSMVSDLLHHVLVLLTSGAPEVACLMVMVQMYQVV